MGTMDKMMEFMMGKMSKEEKEEMMGKMMESFFADFTPEDRQKMMEDMMQKMMEGVDMREMMPKMMMSMMGGGEGEGGMMGMMSKMMGGGEGQEATVSPKMMTEMMPKCVEMMLLNMPGENRVNFAMKMVSTLIEKGCVGMSDEEKKKFVIQVEEKVKAN